VRHVQRVAAAEGESALAPANEGSVDHTGGGMRELTVDLGEHCSISLDVFYVFTDN